MNAARIRQILLLIVGFAQLATVILTLVDPRIAAEALGFHISSVGALSEFRAVYTGMFLGLAIGAFIAARHVENLLLGDLIAMAVLGEALARVSGLVLDGYPGEEVMMRLATETFPALILLLRPRLIWWKGRASALGMHAASRSEEADPQMPSPRDGEVRGEVRGRSW